MQSSAVFENSPPRDAGDAAFETDCDVVTAVQ